jgi:hypothetical protein
MAMYTYKIQTMLLNLPLRREELAPIDAGNGIGREKENDGKTCDQFALSFSLFRGTPFHKR